MRISSCLALLFVGCFSSHSLDGASPPASAPSELGRWVFPTGACGDDHTLVVQLCPGGSAQTIPGFVRREDDPVTEGRYQRDGARVVIDTFGNAASLELVYDGARDVLSLPARDTCRDPVGLREAVFLARFPDFPADWGERAYVHHLPPCP